MPMCGYSEKWERARRERARKAIAKVKAKFPDLLEGSSGWHRAYQAYLK